MYPQQWQLVRGRAGDKDRSLNKKWKKMRFQRKMARRKIPGELLLQKKQLLNPRRKVTLQKFRRKPHPNPPKNPVQRKKGKNHHWKTRKKQLRKKKKKQHRKKKKKQHRKKRKKHHKKKKKQQRKKRKKHHKKNRKSHHRKKRNNLPMPKV